MYLNSFLTEFVGLTILMAFGNGVVANVLLNKSKGQGSGWIVIVLGWAAAVFLAASVTNAQLNPAGTIASYMHSGGDFKLVLIQIAGQFTGAIFGAALVYLMYKLHFDNHENADEVLACFCTAPAIRNPLWNFVTEFLATFFLILIAAGLKKSSVLIGSIGGLSLFVLILGLGLSLGGPTGYALNPARDLGPRIAHFLLPLKNKRNSDWGYSWIPVLAPILGAIVAMYCVKLLAPYLN
jgi:glycerol uptake facilitator protein